MRTIFGFYYCTKKSERNNRFASQLVCGPDVFYLHSLYSVTFHAFFDNAYQFHNHHHHYHQSVLPKGRSLTTSTKTWYTVLPKAGITPQTQEPRLQFYLGLNTCGSILLLSAPHSLFSIRKYIKGCENIPGTSTWR